MAAPAHARPRGAGIAERVERAVAAILRHDVGADDRHEGDEHEDAVTDLAEGDRQEPRDRE